MFTNFLFSVVSLPGNFMIDIIYNYSFSFCPCLQTLNRSFKKCEDVILIIKKINKTYQKFKISSQKGTVVIILILRLNIETERTMEVLNFLN